MPTTSSAAYSSPISISATTTFRAIAASLGIPNSAVALATYSIVLPQAPQPLFLPPPSTFSSAQSVKLSNSLNLQMYYTTDGSIPTTNSTLYSGPIIVSMNTTISAITSAYGYVTSPMTSGTYYIQGPNPTISPASGMYYATVNVTISDVVNRAIIYYTTNGSIPTTASTACANPCRLAISATTTLKAIAAGGGYASSNVAVATFTIAANNPTFSPGIGNLLERPERHHIRHDGWREDLLHHERIDTNDLVNIMLKPVHHHSRDHGNGQGHRRRKRNLAKRRGLRNLHDHWTVTQPSLDFEFCHSEIAKPPRNLLTAGSFDPACNEQIPHRATLSSE